MSWTDERVEKLQEMWNEGLSAAQIAKALGGVTRNAVIGKVHRLGLSNRAPATPQKAGGAAEAPEPEESAEAIAVALDDHDEAEPVGAPEPEPIAEPAPPLASPARPAAREPQRREPQPISEDRLELLATVAELEKTAKRVTLLDLTEKVCKWPIGDPTDPDFRFCGNPAQPGKPYCSAHVAVAFQPMSSRRDRDRARIRI
jgi:GcrA cell cycle regulator